MVLMAQATRPGAANDLAWPMILLVILAAVAALAGGWAWGAFRPRTILGPVRTGPREPIGPFLAILLGGFLGLGLASVAAARSRSIGFTSFIGPSCGAAVMLFLGRAVRPGWFLRLGLGRERLGGAIKGALPAFLVVFPIVILMGFAVAAIIELLGLPSPSPHPLLEELARRRGWSERAWLILSAIVAAPLYEELFFRGVLQTLIIRVIAPVRVGLEPVPPPTPAMRWAGVYIAAILFASVHLSLAFFPPLFVLAMALGYIYERTGNLWLCILLHGLFNAAQTLIFLTA